MSSKNELMQDLLYMRLLQPEEGYQVDFAVGCSFSLSMEGLVAVPLAFSKMGEAKTLDKNTAMYLMEGILRCSEKFVLFCNKGFIHAPAKSHPLYSLMENSVVEVASPANPLANFHPKMWVIRLKPLNGNGADVIKLIVMSRNLTFSRDLDVAISVKGNVIKGVNNGKNSPVADFLWDLADNYDNDSGRKKKIQKLADDFEHVKCFDFESPFYSNTYKLYPSLFPKDEKYQKLNKTLLQDLQGKRVLIISPFLDSDPAHGIWKSIIKNAEEKYLVTCDYNVTQQVLKDFDAVYVPNPVLTDVERNPVNLHAKMYLVEQENGAVYLYLGSTNATRSAFQRNAELCIRVGVGKSSFEQMFDELVAKDNLYIQVSEPMVDEAKERERRQTEYDLEHVMRWAMSSLDSAVISKTRNANANPYHVILKLKATDKRDYQIGGCFNDYSVGIRPLLGGLLQKLDRGKQNFQWDLQLEELSEFYVIEVTENKPNNPQSKSGVCKVETKDLRRFVDERNESIVNSIVNRDNVMQYIDMILSDFPEYTFENWNQRRTQTGMTSVMNSRLWDSVAIYEQLLKASYENRSKLEELRKVLPNLEEKDYPEGLKPILDAFGITVKRKKKQ